MSLKENYVQCIPIFKLCDVHSRTDEGAVEFVLQMPLIHDKKENLPALYSVEYVCKDSDSSRFLIFEQVKSSTELI